MSSATILVHARLKEGVYRKDFLFLKMSRHHLHAFTVYAVEECNRHACEARCHIILECKREGLSCHLGVTAFSYGSWWCSGTVLFSYWPLQQITTNLVASKNTHSLSLLEDGSLKSRHQEGGISSVHVRESVPLPFSTSGGCLHFLAHDPFRVSFQPLASVITSTAVTFLSPFCRDPCDYNGPIWKIQDNLISRSLT